MQPEEVPPLRPNATFVLPRYKLVYVSSPKAACTTIKWLLADLQGIKPGEFYSSLSGETTRATTIHQRRYRWPGTPRLRDLSREELAEITADNGWFLFTTTRHPSARLWSAWQSKFLLREPRFRVQFRDEPWLPRIPNTTADVIEDWRSFVAGVSAKPGSPVMKDVHFHPLGALLNWGVTRYHRVYDTSQFKQALADVETHLRGQGWSGELVTRRSNETPLPPIAPAFTPDVIEGIQRLYGEDFDQLGYDDPLPPKLRDDEEFAPGLVAATAIIAERGERIGDLSRRARRLWKSLKECRDGDTDGSGGKSSTVRGLLSRLKS